MRATRGRSPYVGELVLRCVEVKVLAGVHVLGGRGRLDEHGFVVVEDVYDPRETRALKAHAIDLLVLNTKDEDHSAMHGLAYPLAVELRNIPLLML